MNSLRVSIFQTGFNDEEIPADRIYLGTQTRHADLIQSFSHRQLMWHFGHA